MEIYGKLIVKKITKYNNKSVKNNSKKEEYSVYYISIKKNYIDGEKRLKDKIGKIIKFDINLED